MDIFRLENIINALRLDKKVEPPKKGGDVKGATPSSSSDSSGEDSIMISEEAFLKSTIEEVSSEAKAQTSEVREDKVAQIRDEIACKRLHDVLA